MRRLALICFFLLGPLWAQELPSLSPIAVQATERDGHVLLSAQFSVPVSQAQAFSVLTDFDHMAEFMPNMSSSKVISRAASRLMVRQQGAVSLGLFTLALDSEREIELHQMDEIIAHSLNASQGPFSSKMQLQGQEKETLMLYQADWQPKSAFLASLGKSYLQEQVVQQFTAMQKEMIRRSKIRLASAPQGL